VNAARLLLEKAHPLLNSILADFGGVRYIPGADCCGFAVAPELSDAASGSDGRIPIGAWLGVRLSDPESMPCPISST
jgi:hypothetical protein